MADAGVFIEDAKVEGAAGADEDDAFFGPSETSVDKVSKEQFKEAWDNQQRLMALRERGFFRHKLISSFIFGNIKDNGGSQLSGRLIGF